MNYLLIWIKTGSRKHSNASCLQCREIVLKPRPIPMPAAEIGYSLQRGRGGSLDCMWGVQTHSGPPVFLVPFRKDLARMNGTPQPNQKWLPALEIELGSLDQESQPLTIGPFLTPWTHGMYNKIRTENQSTVKLGFLHNNPSCLDDHGNSYVHWNEKLGWVEMITTSCRAMISYDWKLKSHHIFHQG